MKSIKEKAEDIQLGYDDIQAPAIGRGFVLGANYVLEQIEDVLTNPRRYVNPDKSVEEGMVDAIIKCVEQLKSNQ